MNYQVSIQSFEFTETTIQLMVPDAVAVQQKYLQEKQNNGAAIFPYWAKLWPASIALCHYIALNKSTFQKKKVLELAAGLGLPSMLVAKFASQVICSDYASEALPYIEASTQLNQLNNIEASLIDWNNFPEDVSADIILLSDINYEPDQFKKLHELIILLLNKHITILLTTPQRLMAKPFIEQLLPYCSHSEIIPVNFEQEQTDIFLLKLHKDKQEF